MTTPTTQALEPELLPCPFCKSVMAVLEEKGTSAYVLCTQCGAEGPWMDASETTYHINKAIAAWNRRSPALAAIEADRDKREGGAAPQDKNSVANRAYDLLEGLEGTALPGALHVRARKLREALATQAERQEAIVGTIGHTRIPGMSPMGDVFGSSAAPVSAGLSDDLISTLWEEHTGLNIHTVQDTWLDADEIYAFARALASRLSQRVAEGWQPIETAPKDGTPILVANTERGAPWVAQYQPIFQSGYRPENPWFSLMLNCQWHPNQRGSFMPSMWQPLPAIAAAPMPEQEGK